jgi:xanthine dehydrogenase accessory factor
MPTDIYREAVSLAAAGVPFAMAVVTETQGSTPQRPGARSIFTPDGRSIGTLGGGCLEAEARRRALECLRSGNRELFRVRLDGDFGFDDGLICGGIAQVFIDPRPGDAAPALEELVRRRDARVPCALITVIGPPDGPLGHCELHTAERPSATFGEAATEAIAAGSPLVCGVPTQAGELLAYVEPIIPPPRLLIAGAGHIGQAVCHLAAMLGFEVTVVDDRPSFANEERLPDAAQVVVDDIPTAVRDFPIGPDTYVVIVTRGHRHDGQVLRECIGRPAAYIGMIGSRRKIRLIYQELVESGVATPEQLRRVHSPIGLDIGGVTVEEIAVSIAAELVMVRRGVAREGGRSAPPLNGAASA